MERSSVVFVGYEKGSYEMEGKSVEIHSLLPVSANLAEEVARRVVQTLPDNIDLSQGLGKYLSGRKVEKVLVQFLIHGFAGRNVFGHLGAELTLEGNGAVGLMGLENFAYWGDVSRELSAPSVFLAKPDQQGCWVSMAEAIEGQRCLREAADTWSLAIDCAKRSS